MPKYDLFLPLTKVDVDQRMVYGIATAERPDRSGEICDYETTKPHFQAWSNEACQASGGKSLGAVRAMHSSIAAGKLTDITFDDDNKQILVAAKIVDDAEWEKVQEGVYTGFSQGGRYVKRWPDEENPNCMRFTAKPMEISLVDVPCLPVATFQMVKGGCVEEREFAFSAAFKKEQNKIKNSPTLGVEALPPSPQVFQDPEGMAKAALALVGAAKELEKVLAENTRLRTALDTISPELSTLTKRIAVLEAQPLPPRGALRSAPPREFDGGGVAGAGMGSVEQALKILGDLPDHERTMALMKLSLRNPVAPHF